MEFITKLWRRSQKSYATTIPHIVLLSLKESKNNEVVWEYNDKLKKWTVEIKEAKK